MCVTIWVFTQHQASLVHFGVMMNCKLHSSLAHMCKPAWASGNGWWLSNSKMRLTDLVYHFHAYTTSVNFHSYTIDKMKCLAFYYIVCENFVSLKYLCFDHAALPIFHYSCNILVNNYSCDLHDQIISELQSSIFFRRLTIMF